MLWHYLKESKVEDFLDETMSRKMSRSGKSLGMTLWGVCAVGFSFLSQNNISRERRDRQMDQMINTETLSLTVT